MMTAHQRIDFETLGLAALSQARSLLIEWFSAGKFRGREFVVGDLQGSPGESLSINTATGAWSDFATGAAGGDLISLYAAKQGITQIEAGKALHEYLGEPDRVGIDNVVPHPLVKPDKDWKPILPVPADAPAPPARHPTHGAPAHIARYLNRDGELLGLIYRCEPADGRKQIPTLTFCENPVGRRQWRWQSLPKPRSLYGAELLGEQGRVLVVEGEPKCDAARRMVGDALTVVACPGGSQAVGMADWSLLANRDVVFWPDADKPGRDAASQAAILLRHHGASRAHRRPARRQAEGVGLG